MKYSELPTPHKTLAACILATLCAGSAYAQESVDVHPYLDREFILDLGVYFPERKLKTSVQGSIGDVSADFDIDGGSQASQHDSIFALEFGWRFGEKWSFRGQYFGISPSRSATLQEDVEWKDIVFGASTGVTLGSEFKLTRLFFGRKFETGERHDAGIGAGIHWLKIGVAVEGEAIINGMSSGVRREKVSVEAPLPNIGAWYTYSISPRWAAHGRVDWFAAGIDEFDGRLANISAGVRYKWFEHGGIGLSYSVFDLELDINEKNWKGSVDTQYSGLFVSGTAYW